MNVEVKIPGKTLTFSDSLFYEATEVYVIVEGIIGDKTIRRKFTGYDFFFVSHFNTTARIALFGDDIKAEDKKIG